jgi:dephospho-CoA kinase
MTVPRLKGRDKIALEILRRAAAARRDLSERWARLAFRLKNSECVRHPAELQEVRDRIEWVNRHGN